MPQLVSRFPSTILRQRFERARALSLEAQMRECVDYLQNPEVLIQEFVDAYSAVENCCDAEEQHFQLTEPAPDDPAERRELLDRLFAARTVSVFDTVPFEFTCLARDVAAVSGGTGKLAPRLDGLDYVGQLVDSEPVGVIGVVQQGAAATPYVLFLRLVTCLSELAPAAQLAAADSALWKGALGAEPKLDLQMVLNDSDCEPDQATLRQLTHDLAEAFYAGISEEWQFPDVLRNIVCLLPSPPDSDELLILEWCV
ncbi:MAG TPA: hypothetical protein VEI82_02355 [Myxococcota bacterium]|nr:hypothetical protein [Myxococcota bacterium]